MNKCNLNYTVLVSSTQPRKRKDPGIPEEDLCIYIAFMYLYLSYMSF